MNALDIRRLIRRETLVRLILVALFAAAVSPAGAAPFTARGTEEGYGLGSTAWRFASDLTKDSTGVLEICYSETGIPERVIGRIEVRPFNSSELKMPDLRICFARADVDGKEKAVLLVAYGIRTGAYVVDLPNLLSHSMAIAGKPVASSSGEYTLLGFGDRGVRIKDGVIEGARGRLFFRYIGR